MKKINDILTRFKNLDPRESEIFISEILRKNKSFVIAHPEYKLSIFHYIKFIYFAHLRKKGYSVAAIIGHKEFYGLDFIVNKHVLMPRPETELLVDNAIAEIKNDKEKTVLIDAGTGTGCIPISIAKKFPDLKIFATDISRPALRVAEKNAKKNNVKINFLHGDLLSPVVNKIQKNDTLFITANLPYLTRKQFDSEPSIKKEPKTALIADNDNGLSLYEKLIQQISKLDNKASIFLEIDPGQSAKIKTLIKKYLLQSNTDIKKDLSGLDRLVIVKV